MSRPTGLIADKMTHRIKDFRKLIGKKIECNGMKYIIVNVGYQPGTYGLTLDGTTNPGNRGVWVKGLNDLHQLKFITIKEINAHYKWIREDRSNG